MKNNVARLLSLILVICLLAAMAVGCGADDDDDDRKSDSKKNTSTEDTDDKKPTPTDEAKPTNPDTQPTEGPNADPTEAPPAEPTKEPTKAPAKTEYTLADEVLVDNEYCTFKIVSIEGDNFWGFTVKVLCENKTADKKLMFAVESVSVNGYLIDPFWAKSVDAGKKATSDISFSSTRFEEAGFSVVDEIKWNLRIYDDNNLLDDRIVDDFYAIYPTGKSAETVQYPARKTTATEQVVVDNSDYTFIILSAVNDDFWGYTLKCYVENKTDKNLMFDWDDVSVNGFMLDPYWSMGVGPKMKGYSEITFSDTHLEENGITTVEEIEYTLDIYDDDDWMADHLFEEKLTYKP